MERDLRVAPWGVIILVLYGLACTMLGARSFVDDIRSRRAVREARLLGARWQFLIDSISHAPYVLSPRDSLRRRYQP